jgi:hypothetical protein
MNNFSSIIQNIIGLNSGSVINVSNAAISVIGYNAQAPVNVSNLIYNVIVANPSPATAFSYAYIIE